MRIFCVVGARRGVGKTRLIEKLVKELKKRKIKVSTVKHTMEEIDIRSKDTSRHLNAGADVVMAISPKYAALFIRETNLHHLISKYMPKRGLIIIEGFRSTEYPKIIVAEAEEDLKIEGLKGEVIAIVCRNPSLASKLKKDLEKPVFQYDQIPLLAELILNRAIKGLADKLPGLNCGLCGYSKCLDYAKAIVHGEASLGECALIKRVKVEIDGEKLVLKPFVENSIARVIEGYLSSLKGFKREFKKITITIECE